MAFQFPVSPTVGQVFSPAAGVSYKWNGTGWSPMAAQAAMLNPDGTVTAPGIAWANEPSAGWYRTPNTRFYAWGGNGVESLSVDPLAPGFTTAILNAPLANGTTTLMLNNAPATSSVYRSIFIRTRSTGHEITESLGGGATALPLTLGFPAGVSATGPVRVPDGTAGAPGMSWGSDPDSGWFRDSTLGNLGYSKDGVQICGLTNTAVYSFKQHLFDVGTAAAPGISWVNDSDSGFQGSGGTRFYSSNGLSIETLGADGNGTYLGLSPRAAGAESKLVLSDNAYGAAGALHQLRLRNISSGYVIDEFIGSPATSVPLNVNFPAGAVFNTPATIINGQLTLNKNGWAGGINNWDTVPVRVVSTTAGSYPAIAFSDNVLGFQWQIANKDHILLLGSNASGGTVSDGWAMSMTNTGAVYARSFTPVALAATNVVPMTGALSDILKLRGVRCLDTETQLPDIRLELDATELVFPELVSDTGTGKGINYAVLAAPIVEAIRELHNRVTTLEANGIPVPR